MSSALPRLNGNPRNKFSCSERRRLKSKESNVDIRLDIPDLTSKFLGSGGANPFLREQRSIDNQDRRPHHTLKDQCSHDADILLKQFESQSGRLG